MVFVSHRLEEVMEVSDRISVLKDGELVGTFPAAEMTTKQLSFLMTGRVRISGTRVVVGKIQHPGAGGA